MEISDQRVPIRFEARHPWLPALLNAWSQADRRSHINNEFGKAMIVNKKTARCLNLAKLLSGAAFSLSLAACGTNAKTAEQAPEVFSKDDAVANIAFAAKQYETLLRKVDAQEDTYLAYGCEQGMFCVPSAMEKGYIELSAPSRWTIGFFPGVLWMILNQQDKYQVFENEQRYSYMFDKAVAYSALLEEQSKRTNTHDLGMMIDHPIQYAIQNKDLSEAEKSELKRVAKTGQQSLTALYGEEKGLMRSWVWEPMMWTSYVRDGETVTGPVTLSNPWQYPVIIDNMMNVEYLMKSDDPKVRKMGFSHSHQTAKNHFHYAADDTQKERPIAYHAFDYGEMKPGNWQGLGNISAWARGQGWAIYGFVASAEFAKKHPEDAKGFVDFEEVAEGVFETIKHYTADDKVPHWDYFATRSDAYDIAAYAGEETAQFSRMLNLCIEDLPEHVLPYQGFGPIGFPESILSDEALNILRQSKSVAGEDFVQDGLIYACGTKPYYLDGRSIPKDTSAAGLYAAALYRWASFTDDSEKAREYEAYADQIMRELTQNYRTDAKKARSYELGFVMDEATGHMPKGTEVDTPIVYGDYYFIEANLNKLKLIEMRAKAK